MFTQVNHSLERSEGGLGVGLSLVRHLVELHGGAVAVKSDGEGLGSEFIVRVPALPTTVVRTDRRSAVVTPWKDESLSLGPSTPPRTAT
jgi:signal transduction histidine kinase